MAKEETKKEEMNTGSEGGTIDLLGAAHSNNLYAVRRLLELGADTQELDENGHVPLCLAIKRGHVGVVDLLLEHAKAQGGDALYQALLKKPCRCSELAMIFCAVHYNHLPLVEYLEEKEGQNQYYQPVSKEADFFPHHYAAFMGRLPILESLLAQGVPVDLATPTTQWTALHSACLKDDDELHLGQAKMFTVVHRLVEKYHANVSLRDHDGVTAADLAKLHGNLDIEAYLRGKEREEKEKPTFWFWFCFVCVLSLGHLYIYM